MVALIFRPYGRKITPTSRDCNPGPVFSIPGFGIEKFLIPGFRDPGGITQMAVILANSTKVDKTKSAAGPDK